jgi:3',5'-cyclic-AMP phosphodiesterase
VAEAPVHTLIQISDLHIGPDAGADHEQPVDTHAVLGRALRALEDVAPPPSAVLFTGDLTEHGAPEQYRRLRALVDPAVARIGTRAVYLAGNHDDRAALREQLLDRAPTAEPLDQVEWIGDLRVIALDSTVPGLAYGELGQDQLDWLRAELASPAPAGTVLALHHPPLPSPAPLATAIELVNPGALAAAIAGTDVRVVLAGHTHVVSAGALAGVPVWTGGAIAPTFDGLVTDGALRGLASPSVSRVDLFADAVLVTGVPFDAEALTRVPADQMRPKIEALRAELPTSDRR